MKISLITVGKLKEKYLKEGILEYSKRLTRYCDLEVIEVGDEPAPENLSEAQEQQVKKKEADKIMARIKDGAALVVLDIRGERITSERFAQKLQTFFVSGYSHIVFVIGGSLGLDQELVKSAKLRMSMSDMTFPHQLARLLFLEQLYRAFRIMNGEPYHK